MGIWSGTGAIATNQTVTFSTLRYAINSGVFYLKANFSTTEKCITKSGADTYVYIDTANTGYSPKASNQLVVKTDLTTLTFTTFFPRSISTAYNTAAGACGSSYLSTAFTSADNTSPTVNALVYSNSGLTNLWNGGSQWFQMQYGGTNYVVQIDTVGAIITLASPACTSAPDT